ncbi:MAG: guanylate kinase, partial [Alphaproteobacteria bacterium]|nr:guanylate kinase [Alphaproteobacteria bacterium]
FVISATSGAGKTTLSNHLLKVFPNLVWSVSATTRPQRKGEIDGKDYYFLTPQEFEKRIAQNAFLEYATVYGGSSAKSYGTLRKPVEMAISSGKSLVCEIDIQGFYLIKKNYTGKVVSIFIKAPSLEITKERLLKRGTNTLQEINERLETAKEELKHQNDYDYVIVNDNLEIAKKEIEEIFRKNL